MGVVWGSVICDKGPPCVIRAPGYMVDRTVRVRCPLSSAEDRLTTRSVLYSLVYTTLFLIRKLINNLKK